MTFIHLDQSKLIWGDSLKVLTQLPKKKFNLLLTDPPYGISRRNNYTSMGRQGIDFGDWDKEFDQLNWISLVNPLLADWASIVIWNDWKKLGYIADYMQNVLGFQIKTNLCWLKSNPSPFNCKRRFLQSTEQAIWAVKPGKKKKGVSWTFNSNYHHGIFKTGVPQHQHPTKKPTPIFQEIIQILTNEGDWVIDPFVGSGTTAIACEKLKRNYVCIEKERKYYTLAIEGLGNAD